MTDVTTWETHGPLETEHIGRALGTAIGPRSVVALRGELGAGKTVLVRGIVRGFLGSNKQLVTSPTYVLQHVYRGEKRQVFHLDAYRISGGYLEFEDSGLGECFLAEESISCIEWPEKVEGALPACRLEVAIIHKGAETRIIQMRGVGGDFSDTIKAVRKQP